MVRDILPVAYTSSRTHWEKGLKAGRSERAHIGICFLFSILVSRLSHGKLESILRWMDWLINCPSIFGTL